MIKYLDLTEEATYVKFDRYSGSACTQFIKENILAMRYCYFLRWCRVGVVTLSLALTVGMLASCTSSGSNAVSPSPTTAEPREQSRTATIGAPNKAVPVIPCDASAIPRKIMLPSSVMLPSGASVFATTQPGISSVTLTIAPVGFTCTALEGGDGSFVISFTAPGKKAAAISYGYSSGGAMINLESACGYFPTLKALDAELRGGHAMCYPHPSGEVVRRIATGDSHALAATIVDPPGTLPSIADPSHGQEESIGVIVADTSNAQEANCVLPSNQRRICIAGLSLFVDQSIAAKGGAAPTAAIQVAVNGL